MVRNMSSSVLAIAWRCVGAKPLSEQLMTQIHDATGCPSATLSQIYNGSDELMEVHLKKNDSL